MSIETLTMRTHRYQRDMQVERNLHTHHIYNSFRHAFMFYLSTNIDSIPIKYFVSNNNNYLIFRINFRKKVFSSAFQLLNRLLVSLLILL